MTAPRRLSRLVARSARVHALRRRITTLLALAAVTVLPWLIWQDYATKQEMRERLPARQVPVVASDIDDERPGYSKIAVRVDGREVVIGPPIFPPAPRVGDAIAVVVDPLDPTNVMLAEDPDARVRARDDAIFGSLIALCFIALVGWGPGLPPRRALRSLRRPGATSELTAVRVLSVQRKRPPQGLIYEQWRKTRGSDFYALHLSLTGRQTVLAHDAAVVEAGPARGPDLVWHGHAYDEPLVDAELLLAGGHSHGRWAVLVRDDRGAPTLLWPVVPLRAADARVRTDIDAPGALR